MDGEFPLFHRKSTPNPFFIASCTRNTQPNQTKRMMRNEDIIDVGAFRKQTPYQVTPETYYTLSTNNGARR